MSGRRRAAGRQQPPFGPLHVITAVQSDGDPRSPDSLARLDVLDRELQARRIRSVYATPDPPTNQDQLRTTYKSVAHPLICDPGEIVVAERYRGLVSGYRRIRQQSLSLTFHLHGTVSREMPKGWSPGG